MKNIVKRFTLPVIIICMVLGLSQTALASGTFRVTTGVHVRETGSTAAKSLTTVGAGESVDVIEHIPDGWSKVQVGSIVGYIRSDFLKFSVGDTPEAFRVTAGVHVRESSSTSANSLKVVTTGTIVDVLEHKPDGWSKVQVGSTVGYIRSDFLKHPGTATLTSGGNMASGSGSTATELQAVGNVNMRASASPSANVLKVLGSGERVEVLEYEANGWTKVSHNGTTGYIRSDLLVPLSTAVPEITQTRYTIGNVNLRTSASETSDKIRTLTKATAVEVIANESNGWSKVTHNGTTGYIRSDLLTTSAQGEPQKFYTVGNVNMRSSASTSSSVIRTLTKGTAVEVLENVSSGNEVWSRVTHNDTTGYIRSDLLSLSPTDGDQVIAIMKTITGVNVRSGPSTSTQVLTTLVGGTSVDVLANESNGWSRVRVGSTLGYIRSDLLHAGANVELVTMSEIRHLLPYRENIRVVDVRTGISFNIKIFSIGVHADYEPATREDTDAMFSTRNGIRSWSARPVWVYVGNRVFAAATHGMPHDVSWIKDNGCDGHLCLHFHNTTNSNVSYQNDLRRAAQEAYDKRPR